MRVDSHLCELFLIHVVGEDATSPSSLGRCLHGVQLYSSRGKLRPRGEPADCSWGWLAFHDGEEDPVISQRLARSLQDFLFARFEPS